jgi:hypothetical protein
MQKQKKLFDKFSLKDPCFLVEKWSPCYHKMQKENSYKSQANTTSSNETNSIQLCLNIGSNLIETWYLDYSAT